MDKPVPAVGRTYKCGRPTCGCSKYPMPITEMMPFGKDHKNPNAASPVAKPRRISGYTIGDWLAPKIISALERIR